MQRGAAELRRADLTSTTLHFMNGSQKKALAKQKAPNYVTLSELLFWRGCGSRQKRSKNTDDTSRKMYVGFRNVFSRDGPTSRFSHDEFHWLVRTAC